jgi:hypothetical protein
MDLGGIDLVGVSEAGNSISVISEQRWHTCLFLNFLPALLAASRPSVLSVASWSPRLAAGLLARLSAAAPERPSPAAIPAPSCVSTMHA